MKLNLGAGLDIQAGWVNVDRQQRPGVDVVWDLDVLPWPWTDGEATEIRALDILEHLDDMTATMDECWRVLQVGGMMRVRVPVAGGPNHYDDPTHKRGFTPNSFNYYCPATQGDNPLVYGRGRWKLVRRQDQGANLAFVLRRLS